MYRIVYTHGYIRRAAKFIREHPELERKYEKVLELLELNPSHPSLRLHKLKGRLKELSAVSINPSYRILLYFLIRDNVIYPVDIGKHDDVYR